MQADSSIRILLALILICLVVMVFQGFGGERASRYKVSVINQTNPWLMRVDTATGRVESLRLKGKRVWAPLDGTLEEFQKTQKEAKDLASTSSPAPEEAAPPPPPNKPRPMTENPLNPANKAEPAPAPARRPKAVEMQPENQVDALGQAMSPSNPPEIRAWAASQLAGFDAAESVPVLVESLGDDDATVVVAVIEALKTTGDEAALSAIRELVTHPDSEVQAAAKAALESE